MWAGFLDICYAFKGKYSKISVKDILKDIVSVFLMATGGALVNARLVLPRREPPIGVLAKLFCHWASSHCNTTPVQGAHGSLFLADGNMASPSGYEAMAAHLPTQRCLLGRACWDIVGSPGTKPW